MVRKNVAEILTNHATFELEAIEYYAYILDRDFGPPLLKFCSYFPYPAKLCLNGTSGSSAS
mgnify:CR=1 FL=1